MTHRSKRERERRIDGLRSVLTAETLSVAQFLSGDWTPVSDKPHFYRDPETGTLGRIPPAVARILTATKSEADP